MKKLIVGLCIVITLAPIKAASFSWNQLVGGASRLAAMAYVNKEDGSKYVHQATGISLFSFKKS